MSLDAWTAAIVSSSSDAIIGKTLDGVILSWNPAAERMYGWSADEAVGRPISLIVPADRAEELNAILRRVQAGGTVPPFETERLTKDGRRIPVALTVSPVHDPQGGLIGASAIARDLTLQKAIERRLIEADRRYATTLDNLVEGFQIIDREWRYVYVNEAVCRQGRKPAEELLCRRMGEAYPGIEATPLFAALRRTMEERTPVRLENEFVFPDGSRRWFELAVDPVPDGISIVSLDIERRKASERALEQIQQQLEARVAERTAKLAAVNRELEAFSYSVSHDLRAPLRALDGFSQVLLEDYDTRLDDEGRDALHRIRAASQRMGEMIDDLLTLSRISRGELKRRRVVLAEVVRPIVEELRQGADGRRVELSIDDALTADADPHLLAIALQNLLANAWKFTRQRDPAVIELGSTLRDGAPVLFLRDNGAGFDPAYRDKLFVPFQRLHTRDEYEGSGIGLAIVRRIVRRHGGEVWAEGQPQRGATFYFTFGPPPPRRRAGREGPDAEQDDPAGRGQPG